MYGYAPIQIRTHEEHIQHAHEAELTRKVYIYHVYLLSTNDSQQKLVQCNVSQPVYGVKGSCVLNPIPGFDTIMCCPVDYMHCVLLGVVRRLMSLWFKSSNHGSDWYMYIVYCLLYIAACIQDLVLVQSFVDEIYNAIV